MELVDGDAEAGGERCLAQPQDNSAFTDALPDVLIDLDIFGSAGFGPSRSSRHHALRVS